jgi:hypothetical protein
LLMPPLVRAMNSGTLMNCGSVMTPSSVLADTMESIAHDGLDA